jgi:glycine/D-amino acid oxidase-like deaminating enzyme/nitrite reductase/ring-hydroxylating ferredoxin subunit
MTSGYHDTCWIDTTRILLYESLHADLQADVLVIGGGIAGLSVAYNLVRAGRQVVVLEDGNIGSGESGRTTAHLVNALDDRYTEIERIFGEEKARLAAESHTAAIDFIEDVVVRENIDCDFLRVDGYLFLHPSDKLKTLTKELEATQRAGIVTEMLDKTPGLATEEGPCLKFPDQAQFHPLKYLEGLCKAITKHGGQIYTGTHVSSFGRNKVEANGHTVRAHHIVVATNTPINDRVTIHTKQFAYRTYVIAAKIPKGSVTPALWWDTGDQESVWVTLPYHYVRTQPFDETHDLLICGGEDHKTGQPGKENVTEEERYHILEHWARQRFPMMQSIAYVWSGQVLEPLDAMGFIGRNPGDDNVYIATGDSGNGMTHGTIAGMLIRDLIVGRANPWEKLYDPARISLSVAGDYVKEVSNMAAQYLDYLTAGDIESVQDVQPNDGAVVRMGARKVAVYRDGNARLHAFSAVCPHLGCNVRWNSDERSFDCPCHGSRFTCEGKVMNGPATSDLKPISINVEEDSAAR